MENEGQAFELSFAPPSREEVEKRFRAALGPENQGIVGTLIYKTMIDGIMAEGERVKAAMQDIADSLPKGVTREEVEAYMLRESMKEPIDLVGEMKPFDPKRYRKD